MFFRDFFTHIFNHKLSHKLASCGNMLSHFRSKYQSGTGRFASGAVISALTRLPSGDTIVKSHSPPFYHFPKVFLSFNIKSRRFIFLKYAELYYLINTSTNVERYRYTVSFTFVFTIRHNWYFSTQLFLSFQPHAAKTRRHEYKFLGVWKSVDEFIEGKVSGLTVPEEQIDISRTLFGPLFYSAPLVLLRLRQRRVRVRTYTLRLLFRKSAKGGIFLFYFILQMLYVYSDIYHDTAAEIRGVLYVVIFTLAAVFVSAAYSHKRSAKIVNFILFVRRARIFYTNRTVKVMA